MKFSGHESFYPRNGWLDLTNLDKDFSYPTDYYGVGINMVKSIQFWQKAFELDKSIETDKWVLHDRLIRNESEVTSFHWFFCHSGLNIFTKENLLESLKEWIKSNKGPKVSDRTLQNDIQVLINMYSPIDVENRMFPSIFSELSLIEYNVSMNRYTRKMNPEIPAKSLLKILRNFQTHTNDKSTVIDLTSWDLDKNSPIFTLGISPDKIFDILETKLNERILQKLALSRTAGMRTMRLGELTKYDWENLEKYEKFEDNLLGI